MSSPRFGDPNKRRIVSDIYRLPYSFHFRTMHPNQIEMVSILETVSKSHGNLCFYFGYLLRVSKMD